MAKKIIKAIIKGYQVFLSPSLGRNCRFYPSCSSYALAVMDKYGFLKGILKTMIRVLRCHPFNKGGVDLP
jgi:hypothetical protein